MFFVPLSYIILNGTTLAHSTKGTALSLVDIHCFNALVVTTPRPDVKNSTLKQWALYQMILCWPAETHFLSIVGAVCIQAEVSENPCCFKMAEIELALG